jgi:formate/nitrite transporter FocA (FNT family)
MGLSSSIKGMMLKSFINKLASNDNKVTILSMVASTIIAAKVDYGKLVNLDPNEVGNMVGAIVIAVLGYYTNKPNKESNKEPKQ